jgi:Na+/phosphate symporter
MSVEQTLLLMISKAMEMARLISLCVRGSPPELAITFDVLAQEIHQQEKRVTEILLRSDLSKDLLKRMVQFPAAFERIGDFLESIVKCFRIRDEAGFALSDRAHAELDEVFARLLDLMNDFRDVLITPDEVLLEHLVMQGQALRGIIRDCRSAHWKRMEQGSCRPLANSAYLDILDSAGSINAYLQTMCFVLSAPDNEA